MIQAGAGLAPNYNTFDWVIIYSNGNAPDDFALAHEIGHVFGLVHTFGFNFPLDAIYRELVTRISPEVNGRLSANYLTTGDNLKDTDADPVICSGLNCTYPCSYGVPCTAKDLNGDIYTPPIQTLCPIINYPILFLRQASNRKWIMP